MRKVTVVQVYDMDNVPNPDERYRTMTYSELWDELESIRRMWPGIATVGDPDKRSPKVWGWKNLE